MRIGQNKGSFAVDNYPGTQTGAFAAVLEARIKKIFEKIFEKRIQAKSWERICSLADFIGWAYIYHSRANFSDGFDHRALTIGRMAE